MKPTATIIIGDCEMRYNHSRRFPFDPDMVRIESAMISNYKRTLEQWGYSVEIAIYDNLDTVVSGISADERLALYNSVMDWEYIDPDVHRIITDHVL